MDSQTTFISFETVEHSSHTASRFRISYQALSHIAGLADGVAIAVAAVAGDALYQNLFLYRGNAADLAAGSGLIAACIYVLLARSFGLYRLPMLLMPGQTLGKLIATWALSLLVMTAILFLLKVGSNHSRGSFLTFAVLELLLLVMLRFCAAAAIGVLLARDAIAGRAAVLIGESREIARLNAGNLLHRIGLKEVGRVVLDADGTAEGDVNQRRLVLLEALAFARQVKADEFFIAASWSHIELLTEITDVLRNSPLPVRLLPDQIIRSILDRRAAASAARMLVVEIQRAPLGRIELGGKRLLDIAVASIALLFASPLFVLAGLAIKLDSPGPVIFRQRRKGFDEHPFAIFKFRTMRVLEDGHEIIQAKRDDLRVTRVGRWLRRTSIDELPQLFNVIRGDMSLVGPRPHALAHDDQYKKLLATYCWRHHVKPGITGWAQVNGLRGETTRLEQMQHRIEYDLWYINNWSFGLDARILLSTCFEVLRLDAY